MNGSSAFRARYGQGVGHCHRSHLLVRAMVPKHHGMRGSEAASGGSGGRKPEPVLRAEPAPLQVPSARSARAVPPRGRRAGGP